MIINVSPSVFLLDNRTKTKTIMHRREMSIPVMECNISFYFFKNFDKAANTFVNDRDMHAFPTIRNKIQVEDEDNYLSIGKKFDKSSESEKKRHTRRHHWSTRNQKISRISFFTIIQRTWMRLSRQ